MTTAPSIDNPTRYVIKSPYSLTVVFPTQGALTITKEHPNFALANEQAEDYSVSELEVAGLFKPVIAVEAAITDVELTIGTKPQLGFTGGVLTYQGQEVHDELARRILEVSTKDPERFLALENFAALAYANPEPTARTELFEWCEKANLPITSDGHILGYKYVNEDYTDCYSGKFDNTPGQTISMARSKCDPNRDNACSTGFHFGDKSYMGVVNGGYGKKVLLVKVSPADVTAIPRHDVRKARCCQYTVLRDVTKVYIDDELETVPVHDDPSDTAAKKAAKAQAKVVKKGKGKTAAKARKAVEGKVVIESPVVGRLTKTGFNRLLKEHGSQSKLAKALGISAGTVAAWKRKLGA